MARGKIWSGTLNFVLLSIPVEIVRAVRPGRIQFNLLHRTDHSRLRRRMYCPADDTYVHAEHIVNGYEVEQGRYVVISEEEYEGIAPESSRSIQIRSFIRMDEVDPITYDRPYYLVPKKGAEKPYRLLQSTLKESGKAGIAQFVLHDRQHLAAIWPTDHLLGLMLLHFVSAVRDRQEFVPQQARADNRQVQAMIRVMEEMKGDYTPDQYEDAYRRRIEAYLKEKASRGETVRAPQAERDAEAEQLAEDEEDLVSALEESLALAKGGR